MTAAADEIRMAIELVSVAVAKRLLASNTKNRKLSRARVRAYAHAMKRGEWMVNGETIKITRSGQLVDGQHRLEAVVEAGVGVNMCVVRGLDDDVFKTIDGGKPRSHGDCLHVLGYPYATALATAARLIWFYGKPGRAGLAGGPKVGISNDQLLATIKQHPQLQPACERVMRRPLHTPLLPQSGLVFAYYMAWSRADKRADRFFAELASENDAGLAQPARVLRERLIETGREFLKPDSRTKLAWTIIAWNAYAEGIPIDKRNLSRLVAENPRFTGVST